MASLAFNTPPSLLSLTNQPQLKKPTNTNRHLYLSTKILRPSLLSLTCAYKVVIEHEGEATELQVAGDETILSKALDSGLDIPHDCKLGVCMTCPAKILTGKVDQTEGMLSDDVIESGYGLLCVAYPRSDCNIRTIPEEELLSLQLATSTD
ncbi:Ferredoxin C 1 chloroplastic [Bienertia sinuspersici]